MAGSKAAPGRRFADQPVEAAGPDLAHRGPEGPVAGQHQGVGAPEERGIGAGLGGSPDVPEGLQDAAQVPQAIVHYGDHNDPLVLGTPWTRGSIATAIDNA